MDEQEQPKKKPTPVPVRDLRQEDSGDTTITIEPIPAEVKRRSQENRMRRLRDRPMMYRSGPGLRLEDVDFALTMLADAACMIRVTDKRMGERIFAVPEDQVLELLQQLLEALKDHPDQEAIKRILELPKT